jgi:hypothetical protein
MSETSAKRPRRPGISKILSGTYPWRTARQNAAVLLKPSALRKSRPPTTAPYSRIISWRSEACAIPFSCVQFARCARVEHKHSQAATPTLFLIKSPKLQGGVIVSKPPGLLQFEKLRIRYWIALVSQSHGGARPRIDSDLYKILGIRFPLDRRLPRSTESFEDGHVPRQSLRGLEIDDYVKAGSRMIGNDAAEKMFYSPTWRMGLPQKRTTRDVAKEIQHVLRPHMLRRLPENAVAELLRWRHFCSHGASTSTELTGAFSINQLIHLRQQGLMPLAEWSILAVLLHQEAFLTCQMEHADRLYMLSSKDAVATVRNFFAAAPENLQVDARRFENALFYPDNELAGSPKDVLRSAKNVRGLVLPRVRDERGRSIRKPNPHAIWTQLRAGGGIPSGNIGGTG